MSTKALQVYERIEALVMQEGLSKADAFRKLAGEFDQPVNSVRGAYYTGRRQSLGESAAPRRARRRFRDTSPEGAVHAAVSALESAIDAIEQEVFDAEDRAREASNEHAELAASAKTRIAQIRIKIEALTATEAVSG